MFTHLSTTQKGIVGAFMGFTGFACADACAKWLGAYYDTNNVLFWAYLVCFLFGILMSPILGGLRETLATKKLIFHIARGFCALPIGILVVTALSNGLQLSSLYTVLFLSPFLTTVAAIPIYKESVSLKSWLIIACGFSGILVAFHDGLAGITIEIVYAFCALAFIVGLGLLARPLAHGETLLSLSFYPSLTVIVVLFIPLLPTLVIPSIEHVPVFVLNGICAALGLTGIAYGFKSAPYAIIAPIHYSQMVWALILGYGVFGDVPDFWRMVGASIIIASGIMLVFSKKQ